MLALSDQACCWRLAATLATQSTMSVVFLLSLPLYTPDPFFQFYIGRELNPSIGSFDIKSFNELRPGLILWFLINISMVCVQAVRRGGWENVTYSMWLVLAFQGFYVTDGLYNEVSVTFPSLWLVY